VGRSRQGRILVSVLVPAGLALTAAGPVWAQAIEPAPPPEPGTTLPPPVEPGEPTTTLPPSTTLPPTTTIPPRTTLPPTTTTRPPSTTTTRPPSTTLPPGTTIAPRTEPSPVPTPPPTLPQSPPPTVPWRRVPPPVVLPDVEFPPKSPAAAVRTGAVDGILPARPLPPKVAVKTIASALGVDPGDPGTIAASADASWSGAVPDEPQPLGLFTPGPVRSTIVARSGVGAPARPPLGAGGGAPPVISPVGAGIAAALAGLLVAGASAAGMLRTTRRGLTTR
jgi:collagen type III alpha